MNRDQLDYLAGLVRMDIRKRERALAKFAPKDGQDPAETEAVREKLAGQLAWKREVLEALRSARKQGTP